MGRVYFKPIDDYNRTADINRGAVHLLERVLGEQPVKLNGYAPLKVHFGEKGNTTFIRSENYTGIVDFLGAQKVDSAYIETNVLYRGERQNRSAHEALALSHGFTQLPVVIADGEFGDDFTEVPVNGRHFTTCKIGRAIAALDQMIVVSHFKGHLMAGFGGALKQLAMGCAARGGKLAQHANAVPKIKAKKCDACGACADLCPAGAIALDPKAAIKRELCIGCAACMAVCPAGAVSNSWWASLGKAFLERMAEYAAAAHGDGGHIYLTYAFNLTRGCDCEGHRMKPIAPDLGLLAATDPVAIDQACLDLLEQRKGRRVYRRGRHILGYSEQLGLGRRAYDLVTL
jgi:uncharacterized Fe-S center protein